MTDLLVCRENIMTDLLLVWEIPDAILIGHPMTADVRTGSWENLIMTDLHRESITMGHLRLLSSWA